jgi:hypothetical protein
MLVLHNNNKGILLFSTVEGLALGIEEDNSGIWMNFGATAMHKFVIAFSVGVELVSAQVCAN